MEINYRLHKFVKPKTILREIYFINCLTSQSLCATKRKLKFFAQKNGKKETILKQHFAKNASNTWLKRAGEAKTLHSAISIEQLQKKG